MRCNDAGNENATDFWEEDDMLCNDGGNENAEDFCAAILPTTKAAANVRPVMVDDVVVQRRAE